MLPGFFLFLLKTHIYLESHFEKKQKRKTDITREGDNLPNKYRAEYKHRVKKDISKLRLTREAACQECLNKYTGGKENEGNKRHVNIFNRHPKRQKIGDS